MIKFNLIKKFKKCKTSLHLSNNKSHKLNKFFRRNIKYVFLFLFFKLIKEDLDKIDEEDALQDDEAL